MLQNPLLLLLIRKRIEYRINKAPQDVLTVACERVDGRGRVVLK